MKRQHKNYNSMYAGWDEEEEAPRCHWTLDDKDTSMRTFMHYSDPEAQGEPISVFGAAKKGLFYNYNDRLFGKEWEEGFKLAKKAKLTPGSAHFFEAVLNHFHDSADVNLQHVMLGVNRSNGYHYLVFGYTYTSRSNR